MMSYRLAIKNLTDILPVGTRKDASADLAFKLVKMVHDVRLSSEERATLVEAIAVILKATAPATTETILANLKHD